MDLPVDVSLGVIDGLMGEVSAEPGVGLKLIGVQLSCAIEVAGAELSMVTWDSRLHRAAARRGLPVLPASL